MIFKIQDQKASSFYSKKNKKRYLLITINNAKVDFEDLNSSNGTKLYKLSMEVADEFRTNGAPLGKETMSVNRTGMIQRKIQEGIEIKKLTEKSPVMLNLADEYFLFEV